MGQPANENNDWETAVLRALHEEGLRDSGLSRANPEEIWVRARVDEILEGQHPGPLRKLLGLAQLAALDAAVAVLAWTILGDTLLVPALGLVLSKSLVVALVTGVAHTTVTWSEALR